MHKKWVEITQRNQKTRFCIFGNLYAVFVSSNRTEKDHDKPKFPTNFYYLHCCSKVAYNNGLQKRMCSNFFSRNTFVHVGNEA